MRARLALSGLLAISLSAAILAACSGSGESTSGTGASSSGGGGDAGVPAKTTLRIEPASLSQTITIGAPPAPIAYHAFAKTGDDPEHDVTSDVEWAVDSKLATAGSDGVVTLKGLGGKTTVEATLGAA